MKKLYCFFLSLSLALTPVAAADAERVFAQVSPSVVVVSVTDGHGSGVVVGKGIVVTNCHVVGENTAVFIELVDTSYIEADVVARNDDNDLCLLFADDLTKSPVAQAVKLGAAKDLDIGEQVYAVGAPEGLKFSLSRGIVTQLRGIEGKPPIVQTDAAIWFGSSGGGVFNENSELVGITTFLADDGTDNLNLAMPVEMVLALIESYRNKAEKTKMQTQCAKVPQGQCVLRLAVQVAKQIDDLDSRFNTLIEIARQQTINGYFDDAKNTARQIPTAKSDLLSAEEYTNEYSTDYASDLLYEVAIEQAEGGNFSDAKTIAEQIDDADSRASALGEIAVIQARAGYFKDANATAQEVDNTLERAWALSEIATAQAKGGNVIEAKMIVQLINDDFYRAKSLNEIAIAETKAGYSDDAKMTFDNATHLARQVDAAADRVKILSEIASAQAQAGYSDDAKKILDDALQSVQKISNSYPRDRALRNIAGAQAEVGDSVGAMQTAQSINDGELKAQALANIARALAEQ